MHPEDANTKGSEYILPICFLLGSGISIPAGFPETDDITRFLFDCKHCYRHTTEEYVFQPGQRQLKPYTELIPIIKEFLQFLSTEVSQYYKGKKAPNYEDLFYVVSQIDDAQSKEYDNPAIQPLIDKIPKGILDSWKNIWYRDRSLPEETRKYIMDAVKHMLYLPLSKSATYLSLFADAINDVRVARLDVFSLNHDLLLEQYFVQNGIRFIDGFSSLDGNLRYWRPERYEEDEAKLRLHKLHGSINWCRVGSAREGWYGDRIAIAINPDYAQDGRGNRFESYDKRLFLVGTFNKMLEYTAKDIFLQLLCMFRQRLHASSQLVVSGYGFRDKGINSVLLNWIFSSKHNSLLVVHPKPSSLRWTVGGAFFNKWDMLVSNKVLRFIDKCFQKTSWNDIANELTQSSSTK